MLEDGPLGDVDAVASAPFASVTKLRTLRFRHHVGDEPLMGLGVEPRQVARVRIAVRIPVRDVEEVDEVVAVADRAHGSALLGPGVVDHGVCRLARIPLPVALVVIAEREPPLILEPEASREDGAYPLENRVDLAFVPMGKTAAFLSSAQPT